MRPCRCGVVLSLQRVASMALCCDTLWLRCCVVALVCCCVVLSACRRLVICIYVVVSPC